MTWIGSIRCLQCGSACMRCSVASFHRGEHMPNGPMASAVGDWAQPANTVVADNAQCRARCAGSTNLTHSLHQLKSSNNYFCANVVRCNSAQLLSVVAIISIQTQTVRQVWLLRRRWSCCPASASVAQKPDGQWHC